MSKWTSSTGSNLSIFAKIVRKSCKQENNSAYKLLPLKAALKSWSVVGLGTRPTKSRKKGVESVTIGVFCIVKSDVVLRARTY